MWRSKSFRTKLSPITHPLQTTKSVNISRWFGFAGADYDCPANNENARAFARFFFQARVMRPVSKCDPSTTILGFKSSIPVFVSGAALAKLGHPEGQKTPPYTQILFNVNIASGEANITRGAFKEGIIQMVSSNASLSPKAIMEAADQSQTLFFQLYKHRDDDTAEKRVRDIEQLGYKAIFLTVDAVVPGNRERDIRSPWVLEQQENGPVYYQPSTADIPQGEVNIFGTAGALIANDDRDMTWEKVRISLCLGSDILTINYFDLDDTMVETDIQTSNCY